MGEGRAANQLELEAQFESGGREIPGFEGTGSSGRTLPVLGRPLS